MGLERTRRCERLANELRQVASELTRRLRAATGELSMSQTSVLARLHKMGPSSVADLARGEHVKPQSMGVTVAFLEEEGLVTRKIDPNDGRRLIVSISEAGKEAFLAGRAARQAWLSNALGERLDDAEQRHLLEAMSLLRKVLGNELTNQT